MAAQEHSGVTLSNRWFLLAAVLLAGWLISLLAPVLTPFVTGAVLAYIANPLVNRLQAWRLGRTQAVAVVFGFFALLLTLVLLLLIPMLQHQITTFVSRLPAFAGWVETVALPWVQANFDLPPESFDTETVKEYLAGHWQSAGGFAVSLFGGISRSGLTLFGWIANLLLIPVVTFYLMRDWPALLARIHELVPRRAEAEVVRLARASDEVLGAFLRGQLLVMLALGLVYSIGLWIVGLDLAFLIGMVSGVLSFVPYLGFIVGLTTACLAALMQFHEAMPLLYVVIAFSIAQSIESFFLTPWILGNRVGLHPVAVIFAVLAGGQLFGFVGMLLAVPAAAVIMVLLRYAHERYLQSSLYSPPSGE
jgi:predicted PurR-regulated permease PerM